MNTSELLVEKEEGLGLHPKRLVLILLIFSIIMMFAAFTSGYIVRRDEGNWREFDLPMSLLFNTIVIVLSSAAMQWAFYSAKHDEVKRVHIGLLVTLVLGIVFLFGQVHSRAMLSIGNATIYWHFLGGLWLYLYLFLLLNH